MNKFSKTFIILTVITVFAFIIRIFNSQYPPLLWDEASLGYNAYSLLHTLKDEYGQTLPLILKSFGDYKPALYSYLAIPFISIFGLSELSVRLPSIILGTLLPLFVYLLISQISPKSKNLALITALLLAFNPYNIHFSRGAWETNILTFELVLASYFFFKALSSSSLNTKYLFLSSIIFAATLYTYQAGKMMSVFLIAVLFILNSSFLIFNYKKVLFSFILPLAILTIPTLYGLLAGSAGNRLKVVSSLSYPRPEFEQQMISSESSAADYNINHNQAIFFIRNFSSRYFNHFSPRFLSFEGDWQNPRHSAIYIGLLLYPSIIFLTIGFFSILNTRYLILNTFFLLWLLLAPIPSALTRDSVQAVRAMSLSVPLMYFTALGIYQSVRILKTFFKSSLIHNTYYLILTTAFILSFAYYSDLYHNHTVIRSPMDYLYGYRQATEHLLANQDKFDNVYMSDFYGQPYIYYLFYSKYNPTKYQSQANLTENAQGDTGKVEQIDKVKFASIPFATAKSQASTLVIYSQDEIWRQGLDKSPDYKDFIPLSPIGQISTFYAYQNP